MKRITILLILSVLLAGGVRSQACVGKILTMGIMQSENEYLLAELVSVIINERSGTTVNIKVFGSPAEIYEAVENGEVGIFIENTANALKMMNIQGSNNKNLDYDMSRKEFRDKLNLIWLKPFGFLPAENSKAAYYHAAVITENVLVKFPALPRVINKLKDISENKDFGQIIESIKSGKKVRRAARDFLKKKKLI